MTGTTGWDLETVPNYPTINHIGKKSPQLGDTKEYILQLGRVCCWVYLIRSAVFLKSHHCRRPLTTLHKSVGGSSPGGTLTPFRSTSSVMTFIDYLTIIDYLFASLQLWRLFFLEFTDRSPNSPRICSCRL